MVPFKVSMVASKLGEAERVPGETGNRELTRELREVPTPRTTQQHNSLIEEIQGLREMLYLPL